MKQNRTKPYVDHQELSRLLPWYVNKTLQGAELKAVEAHLSGCLSCKRELVQLQKLAQAVIQEGPHDSAAQVSFTRLKMRLHSQPGALDQQGRPEPSKSPVLACSKQISSRKKKVLGKYAASCIGIGCCVVAVRFPAVAPTFC